MTIRRLAEDLSLVMMQQNMEQVLKKPSWWAWFSLLGLEVPSAAIAWAFVASQSQMVVVSSPWLYQFLFVAVWCINMLDRMLRLFRGRVDEYSDECLFFAKKHCFIISLLIVVAAVAGLWIMFFQLGVVIFQLAFLPGLCSLLFLYFSSKPQKKNNPPLRFSLATFFAAISFALGAGIPAHFYGSVFDRFGGLLSRPTWYFTALIILGMFSRKRWREEDASEQDSPDYDMRALVWMGVLAIYVVFCLSAATQGFCEDEWIYYGLAMAGVFMFVLDRIKKKVSPFLLYTLSWGTLIFSLVLSGVMAQASI